MLDRGPRQTMFSFRVRGASFVICESL